ncbi:MAG: enoyl-CoA hydratase [Actinomycetota bacterium]|jgi:enoyl-CoA hydratase
MPCIVYEDAGDGVARVLLDRPEQRNAQSPRLLYDLDAAFLRAATDEGVRVIVLAAAGTDFSSGHDLKSELELPGPPTATLTGPTSERGPAERQFAFECEAYLGLCRRWREIPKPTIAEVQGRVIAGGLMLIWPLDLVVAADDAVFSDPVTAFGLNGGEYFAHAWEFGARKAKELLFTGDHITATEAKALGMVNHVVPASELTSFTMSLARRIATRPPHGLRLAKMSVNRSLDAQGLQGAIDVAFALHQAGHANNLVRYGDLVDPTGYEAIRAGARAAARGPSVP